MAAKYARKIIARDGLRMKGKINKPFVKYDRASDVIYIATRKGFEEDFVEVTPGVNVEMDDKGNILGVKILRVSQTLKGFLKSLGKKTAAA